MNNENSVDFTFLEEKIKEKKEVDIFLVNGVKLTGIIYKQDANCVVMSGRSAKKEQLVYKNNISTVT